MIVRGYERFKGCVNGEFKGVLEGVLEKLYINTFASLCTHPICAFQSVHKQIEVGLVGFHFLTVSSHFHV